MNEKQREDAARFLGNGATLRETAALVLAPWSVFAREWGIGRSDSEHGRESDLGTWYRECQRARAQKKATLRALSAETAGTRESADTLKVLEALEAEQEPEAVEHESANLSAWSPRAFELADAFLRELTACGVRP